MNFKFSILALFLTIVSCSPDEVRKTEEYYSRDFPGAANEDNPYDLSGEVFDDLLDNYYLFFKTDTTAAGVISQLDSIASAHAGFTALVDGNYESPDASRLDYFFANPTTAVADAVAASPLSSAGKLHLGQFIALQLPDCESLPDYEDVYDIISDYESTVLSSSLLTSGDKRIILTCTSILRYSARRKRKPKKSTDHDWEINVTNIAPTIEGAAYSPASAIVWAGAAGIIENQ